MKNYTDASVKKNVWNNCMTILNIVKKYCNVMKEDVVDKNYPNFLKSAHTNILRHLRDIVDNSVTDSLRENACTKIREHYVELELKNVHNMAYESSKAEIKDMCEALIRDQVGNKSCTNAKDSFEWSFSRFNTVVPHKWLCT
ncbi:hypothetical protein TRVL_08041 [Trypanosoma vivax]|nr:hypothetical protein TRVL_08041 [Trypanosoma vivax]